MSSLLPEPLLHGSRHNSTVLAMASSVVVWQVDNVIADGVMVAVVGIFIAPIYPIW